MSPAFFWFAIGSCLVTSIFGSTVNFYLFYKFLKRDGKANGFQKICLIKTLPNFMICFAFLLWVVPVTALNLTYSQLPYRLNSIVGSLAGSWAYLFTPFLQVSLSCNRFYVLYFPFGIKILKRVPVTNIAIGSAVLIVTCVCSIGLQETCGYVYDPNYFTWRPEGLPCSDKLSKVILFMIFTITFTSNAFNVATGARLLVNKMVGMNREEASRRRKRWMIMFTQSVIQDCLHLIDIINATYIWLLSDELWFQFLFLTLSFVVIYTIDGFPECTEIPKFFLLPQHLYRMTMKDWVLMRMGCRRSSLYLPFVFTSLLGSICNVFLLIKFATRSEKSNGFQKICLVKTIPNIMVCTAYLFWVIPLTYFSYTYDEVAYWMNSLIGGLAGTWAYLLTPILQVSMSCNRFYVLYFPFGIKLVKRFPMTNLMILLAVVSVTTVTIFTLPKGCGYVYNPEYFQWIPEDDVCAENFANGIMFAISGITLTSNVFNVATAARLLMSKMVGMTKKDSSRRRRRWMIMFIQSVLQDCLHLVDIINATYIYKLSDEMWFQFIFLTLSFILIYTLDGLVAEVFYLAVIQSFSAKIISTTETIILDDGVVIEFSPGFLIFAIFLCFSISLLGTIRNIFLLKKFAMRNEKANGFQKTCLVKTIPNIIICTTFLFWIVPIIAFNYSFEEIPLWLNSFIGSSAGVWAYFLTPLLQISMSCNRFYVLYFPFGIKSIVKIPTANIYIFFALICVTLLTFFIFSKGCGYVFYPEYFQLIQEDLECTDNLMKQTMYFIFGFTVVSNSFNVATAARLLMNKMVGMSQRDSTKRRRRWMVLFVQSVLQDCLHLIDIINLCGN
ncbi:CBN-SRX-129 protein [Caenorhabditis brenneri]|uniref:CBN-SRX-129 protein n=1 Tax=Caenorhabditis brenneri TaxID=135651 RepID=G0MRQ8_CAEBE|nr:CBN-SRX-129 protein [Caenorhabditis brenneri]